MRRAVARRLAKVAVLSAGVVLAGWMPKQGQADNLADALIGAYNTSGLLEQNRALLRAADEDVAQTMAALRPEIEAVIAEVGLETVADALPGLEAIREKLDTARD